MSDTVFTLPERLGYLNPTGQLTGLLPATVNTQWLETAYKTMVLTRLFDKKAVALQRTGQMGTYPSCLGQEAVGTGIGMALHEQDIFVPYYRDQATQYLRGVKLHQILQLWGGDERGNLFEGAAARDLPSCIPIANQITHAAGVAVALKSQGVHQAVLSTCGDGATSRGDFYEALNLAGTWQLPLVVVVNNNQWAISVPRALQSGAATLAQKAVAAGIPGLQVDGNDVIAVYQAVHEALAKARAGKGATLIEAVTYRLSDHTTADDASRYRDAREVNHAWEYEPIKRLQRYLAAEHGWNPDKEQHWIQHCQQEIDAAVTTYLNLPPQPVDEFLTYLFEEMPHALVAQRETLLKRAARSGGDHHGI